MKRGLLACTVFLAACTGTIVDNNTGRPGAGADAGVTEERPDATSPAPDAQPEELPLAAGIRIDDIAVYQGVRVPIVEDGAVVADADRGAHVVAGKDGMLGVFVSIDPSWQARPIVGELEIETVPGQVERYTTTQTIAAASGSDPFASGFAFVFEGAHIGDASRYRVTLREASLGAASSGDTSGARYPAGEGTWQDFEAWTVGSLKLVIVPFQYNADGSGRLPPLDDQALQSYRDLFEAMYPVTNIELTVHDPVPYSGSLMGGGWSSWLETLTQLRNSENPPANTYYYGVAAPRATFGAYCNGGCIVGLGWVPGRDDEYGRASVGVSFSDRLGVYTAAHEVGHNMGRNHAPCGGPSGVDGRYPYSGARIGVQGYHAGQQQILSPSEHTDIMGYCDDQWISDYTYDGIIHRLNHVNQPAAAFVIPQRYRVGLIDGSGNVTWRRTTDITSRVGGQLLSFTRKRSDGSTMDTVNGRFYPYDHLPGGMILVPVPSGPQPAAVVSNTTGTVAW